MAWTYEASGDGSDTRKLAAMINARNLPYQWRRQATYGITARETAFGTQFTDAAGTTNNDFFASAQGRINRVRNLMDGEQGNWDGLIESYLGKRGSEEFDDVEADDSTLNLALDGLIGDMYANSKTVKESTITAAQGTQTHMLRSTIHAHATRLNFLAGNTSVQTVEKVSDKSSETLTFEVSSEQSGSGSTSFNVYGDNPASTPDVVGGMGNLGGYLTPTWDSGGLLGNPNAIAAPTVAAEELAASWRCFDDITSNAFDSAPETTLCTRNNSESDSYWGQYDFKWVGDDSNTDLYLAQILANPLRDLDTTAWGSGVNDTAFSRSGVAGSAGKVVVCSFFYKSLPTGHTLTPLLLTGGNARTADETIESVVSDGSSTWRRASFAFWVRPGDADRALVFTLRLQSGSALSSSLNVQLQRISLDLMTSANLFGNVWYVGTPNVSPKALGAKDTFTLQQDTEGNFQKYFSQFDGASTSGDRGFLFPDENGQAYQLPSVSTGETEDDSLITIADK